MEERGHWAGPVLPPESSQKTAISETQGNTR